MIQIMLSLSSQYIDLKYAKQKGQTMLTQRLTSGLIEADSDKGKSLTIPDSSIAQEKKQLLPYSIVKLLTY